MLEKEKLLARALVQRFLKDTKGQQNTVVGVLVTLMVTVLVGLVVVMNIINSQDQGGWSEDANTTWSTLQSNIWVAFTLLVIAPIIIGAVIILSYVRRMG